ncbi:hypothetical protein [Streptomyces liliifuscus]|uniref:Uncharacterized protein n=1 Tax=Streptomyces liliifuscus TaxID=2797636 RepID=A0A7T7RFW7_9ACTN|nr:hypothetical protein [Streptomyces liliifuscus]QQM45207.1 hypothetical protein JEQ17_41250 [Streptomyces liliifuscus]
MPTEYTITDVTEDAERGLWHVLYKAPSGDVRAHVFPKNTLAWRAAEYGIDPADIDTLLDVVLHEPFTPHPDDPVNGGEDPAAAAGLTSAAPFARGRVQAGDRVPTTLYTAESTEKAREAHLLRIEHAKANRARVVAPKGKKDPLDRIRGVVLDPAGIAELAARVEGHRRRLRGDDTPEQPSVTTYDPTAAERTRTMRGDRTGRESP